MNGPHDLGGMMGFGPVVPEANEPVFHAPWEKRALAVTLAMGATGSWPLDAGRHARERIPPVTYLAASYYEIWIRGLETLLQEHGLASAGEIASGRSSAPPAPVRWVLQAADVPAALARGTPCNRETTAPARFAIGDTVLAKTVHKPTHTRLPRYLAGKRGEVITVNGMFVLPDSNAHGGGESPEWCYTVRFTGREVWGAAADASLVIMADLWESYLERA